MLNKTLQLVTNSHVACNIQSECLISAQRNNATPKAVGRYRIEHKVRLTVRIFGQFFWHFVLVVKYMHGFITGGKCGRFVLINKWFFWGESALRSIWHYSQSGSHKVIYDIRSGPSHCLFYQFKVGPDSGDDDRVSEWEYQHRDVRNIQWSNSGTNFFKTFFCHKRWICKHRPNFDVTFEVLLIYNFCQNDLTLKGAILSPKN